MPPVEIETEPSILWPLRVAAHLGLAAYCTVLLASQHLRAASGAGAQSVLPAAQNTRQRSARRAILLSVFAVLAASSLGLATYSGISYARLSYHVWAAERGVAEHHGDDASTTLATCFRHMRAWLGQAPVYRDAVEIIAEKARRLWWGQQLETATAAWGVYLATEGRRRGIVNLAAYLVLAHLVSLSFAQNLFFIAVLLAPTPAINEAQSNRTHLRPRPPPGWLPRPGYLFPVVLATFAAIALTPRALDTPWFGPLALGSRLLTLVPLLLSYLLPASCGGYGDPHAALSPLYRLMAIASALLYAGTTIESLASSTPRPYHHRHSVYLPFDTERRSAWDRTAMAFGRVLGSTADHPAVATVGADVIMSAVSIGVWAAVRALAPEHILYRSVPFYTQPSTLPKRAPESVRGSEPGPPLATPAPRKRGRPRKIKAGSKQDPDTAALAAEGDAPYQPTPSEAKSPRGDESAQPVWESAATAWGLDAVAGLGCASVGVLGGDGFS